MTTRQACALVAVALAPVIFAWAQTQAPSSISNRRPAPTAGKSAAKAVKPDPDLLDGSIYEAEKRPLYGMISEVELPGSEEKSERVGGPPQPAGQQAASASMPQLPSGGGAPPPQQQQQQQSQAGSPPPIQSGQDDRQAQSEGNQAQAAGIQAQNLEGQGSAPSPDEQAKPKDMQIGDATLQIQTVPQNQQQIVGTETTSTQQYEKKVPAGQQTDNRNRGVEKGKVMPKGI
ncbi:MAG TPA: hypothetical protein VEB66_02180 [Opitutaceae bacterium]|nr:hypothetical protein [Opitutaceae bacterium]